MLVIWINSTYAAETSTWSNNTVVNTQTWAKLDSKTISWALSENSKNKVILDNQEINFKNKIKELESENSNLSWKLTTLESKNKEVTEEKEILSKQIETNKNVIEEYKKQVYLIEELKKQNLELNNVILAAKKIADKGKIIEILITALLVLLYILWNFFRHNYRKKLKDEYKKLESEHNPLSLQYYEKMQTINILFAAAWIVLFLWILIYYNRWFFGYLMLAFSAILIIMKEFILDIIWFFIIIFSRYRIWDYIQIMDKSWEVLLINLFNMVIIWKDELWEYNWETYTIPNYKALTEIISKKWDYENNIIRQTLIVHYRQDKFIVSIDEIIKSIQETLDKTLAKNTPKTVWYFKSFIGVKYKLEIDTDPMEFDRIHIRLRWLEDNKKAILTKTKVIKSIEKYKIIEVPEIK